ncbi:Arylsulfatase [Stieleria bergensis]|uniref:Arylsulfatase n=1 Tax=Stieleria bergensis TaxID=2528025 RepID=A0A517SX48_9BACT|nr:Arylsulfatase [Planctomycetes bacterium SV_7m_r]
MAFVRLSFRQVFLALLSFSLVVVGLPTGPKVNAETKQTKRPNVILVFIDDMGWGDFSSFGGQAVQTQHIDRLAKEGLRFEQFYVNSPICSPSRAAISTGQYPQRWQITSYLSNRRANDDRGMAQWLDLSAPMLVRSLHESGYATGHFGKWHLGGQRDVGEAPLISEYGFDESLTNFEGLGPRVLPLKDAYDGKPPQKHGLGSDNLGRGPITWEDRSTITETFCEAAVEFIKWADKRDQPFYVNLWPDDVHSPYFPPRARRGTNLRRDLYHAVLDTMDEQLGVLFDHVRQSPRLRDNTIIVVCSDNGPDVQAGSAGPFRGMKATLFEGGIRSPLIVWAPGLIDPSQAGTTNDESVFSAIDLVPSLLDLTGTECPAGVEFDGEPLSKVLLGQSNESRSKPIFFRRPPDRKRFQQYNHLPDLAVRHRQWKLLCDYDGDRIELYDVVSDPGESQNLAADNPEVAQQLKTQLLKWHESMPADNGPQFKPKKRK